MRLGNIRDLQIALAGVDDATGEPRIGRVFVSALKKAAGFEAKKFDIDAVKSWWKQNPNFKISDVWPRRKKK